MPWKELPVTSSPLSVLQAASDNSTSMAVACVSYTESFIPHAKSPVQPNSTVLLSTWCVSKTLQNGSIIML